MLLFLFCMGRDQTERENVYPKAEFMKQMHPPPISLCFLKYINQTFINQYTIPPPASVLA